LLPHFIGVLGSGSIDVTVSWGEPIAYDMNADRKQIARRAEAEVRRMTSAALRAGAATNGTPSELPVSPQPA
jgi:1-acyl-sn-glycerol-3-phosphate acyltransferase